MLWCEGSGSQSLFEVTHRMKECSWQGRKLYVGIGALPHLHCAAGLIVGVSQIVVSQCKENDCQSAGKNLGDGLEYKWTNMKGDWMCLPVLTVYTYWAGLVSVGTAKMKTVV